MAKTVEQKKAEFIALMEENGFTLNGETLYDGREIYSQVWAKEVEVAFHGTWEKRLEIKVDEAYGIPSIRIFKDGRQQEHRNYSSPKRAINAMKEIVAHNGFQF